MFKKKSIFLNISYLSLSDKKMICLRLSCVLRHPQAILCCVFAVHGGKQQQYLQPIRRSQDLLYPEVLHHNKTFAGKFVANEKADGMFVRKYLEHVCIYNRLSTLSAIVSS